MRRNNLAVRFIKDTKAEGLIRIQIFVGSEFAGSLCQFDTYGVWRVSLFEDWDRYKFTDYFAGKEYKTLRGAKSAASQWIRRNWSVNLEGGE